MTLNVNEKTEEIARTFGAHRRETDWDSLRDYVDQASGGDLDCFQLDMLTDAVQVRAKAIWKPTGL